MATRRAHNKSRLGCQQCKKRRIKCDVKQPSCANCDKKNLECSFLSLAPTSRLSVFSSTSPTTPRLSEVSPSSISDVEYTISPTHTSFTHSASPNSETSIISLASPTHDSPFSETETSGPILDLSLLHFSSSPTPTIPPSLRLPTLWSPILPSLPPALRTLISHYEYTAILTQQPSDPAKAAWLTHLPGLARSHPYLLNCVLSVSSLHLARLHTSAQQRSEMGALAASRMNKALGTYRAALGNVTRDNAAALFASATLTAVYLFRTTILDMQSLRSSPLSPSLSSSMLSCALRPIWGLRGPLAVLMSGGSYVFNGAMHAVAGRKWWPPEPILPATPAALAEDVRLAALDVTGDECIEALALLREAYALVSHLTLPDTYPPTTAIPYSLPCLTPTTLSDRGALFVWATRISRGFLARLEARDPDALVILAHYAVLPGRVRNVWWLEGLGAEIVGAVAMVLGQEAAGRVEWPAQVVGVELGDLGRGRWDRLVGRPEEVGMDVI